MQDKCQKSYDSVQKQNLPRVFFDTHERQQGKQAIHKGVNRSKIVPPDGLTTYFEARLAPAVDVNRGEPDRNSQRKKTEPREEHRKSIRRVRQTETGTHTPDQEHQHPLELHSTVDMEILPVLETDRNFIVRVGERLKNK